MVFCGSHAKAECSGVDDISWEYRKFSESVKFQKFIMVVPETTSKIGNNFYKILHFKFQNLFLGLILKEFSKLLIKKKDISEYSVHIGLYN